jgi:glycosyltransferase involved in cell wall biosynthesis
MVRRGLRAWRKYGTAHVLGRVQELVGTAKSIRALERARVPGEAGAGAAGKALLFIDWGLPRPDRDAGSVMVEALLRIFGELGYRVSFLPVNLEYQPEYTGPLEAAGVECIDNRRFKSVDAYLLAHAREVSIVFACRGPVAEPFIGGIRRLAPRARIVFDTVDLHYVRELRQAEIEGSADLKEKALASKAQELRAISRSDATAILSADELYAVREELPEAKLLYLPLIFDPIPGSQTDYAARADILFVGSFPHRPNVDAVLWFVREILPGIRERLPDLRFLAVGSAPPPEIAALGAVPGVQILGYVKDLDSLLGRVRLTVAPLRYGAGIKGKIGTSLSHGVPCVATPMAVEGMGLIHGRDCLVGEDPQSFADAVVELYSDRALWERLSAGGRDYVDEQLSIGAARRRVAGACFALELGMPLMEQVYEIGSFAEYGKHRRRLADEYRRREGIELALLPRPAERTADRAFQTPGTCAVCGSDRGFLTSYLYAGRKASDGTLLPNWREHLQCRSCGFVNRTRAAIHALYTHAPPPPEARIYLTERVTPLYDWFASRWPGVVGSEYLGPGLPPGSVSAAGVRHEDMANLSFESGSLDYILSFDVLEHVPDYGAALREAHRCLNPGGVLLFSAPFSYDREAHVVRATLGPDGAPVHLLEPEYHGNPVDPEGGALCYRYFGWDLLAELRALGFRRARALCYWSRAEGYLGGESFLLLCEKGDSRTSG